MKRSGQKRRTSTTGYKLVSGYKISVKMSYAPGSVAADAPGLRPIEDLNPYTAYLHRSSDPRHWIGAFSGKTPEDARKQAMAYAKAAGLCERRSKTARGA